MRLLSLWPLSPLVLTSCLSTLGEEPSFQIEVALEAGVKLGGCAAGDLRPDLPGDELVVTAGDGRVFIAWPVVGGWASELVAHLPGEAIQCAIGDLDPTHPGDELVTVGALEGTEDDPGPGVAILHQYEAGTWHRRELLREESLIHAVAIGEACPLHGGNQLALAGFERRVSVLDFDDSGEHTVVATAELPSAAKGAAIGLGGVVLALDGGQLVRAQRRSGGFEIDSLWEGQDPLARVAATESEAIFCSNDGRLRHWSGGEVNTLYAAADRLRGAVLVEYSPGVPGLEAATAGYDGYVTLLERGSSGFARMPDESRADVVFRPLTVGRDEGRLHHLTAAQVRDRGTCLVACGYAGRLLVLRRSER